MTHKGCGGDIVDDWVWADGDEDEQQVWYCEKCDTVDPNTGETETEDS